MVQLWPFYLHPNKQVTCQCSSCTFGPTIGQPCARRVLTLASPSGRRAYAACAVHLHGAATAHHGAAGDEAHLHLDTADTMLRQMGMAPCAPVA